MQTLGYLGPEGTFSHNAAIRLKEKRKGLELKWYNNIAQMVTLIKEGKLDAALLPIENSIDGSVNATLDILSETEQIFIQEEYVFPIDLNLIAHKGMKVDDVKVIYSHPQPIGQCRKYIDSKLHDALINLTYSTTAGVREVKEKGSSENGYAAIGTREAAELFGLELIDESIQDNKNNATRFIYISAHENKGSENTRTSIIFSTDDRPGSLFKVLEIFDIFDVNLKRIESRPSKISLGKYIFFVDIDGDARDDNNAEALRLLKLKTPFYSFLGSYPEYDI